MEESKRKKKKVQDTLMIPRKNSGGFYGEFRGQKILVLFFPSYETSM